MEFNIKYHYLLELEGAIRHFGPPKLFDSSVAESANKVVAPSQYAHQPSSSIADVAQTLAKTAALTFVTGGGLWRHGGRVPAQPARHVHPVPPTHVYKASDPPQLHQTSMEALREYFIHLDYYNRRVARVPVTANHDKIEGAGMGLQSWRSKLSELIRRACPPISSGRNSRCCTGTPVTGHDVHAFQDFSDRMRVLQMEIGFQVVSDQELASLFSSALIPSCADSSARIDAPAEQPGEFDYQVFERIGREEWDVIAQRRAAITTQVAALQQQRSNTDRRPSQRPRQCDQPPPQPQPWGTPVELHSVKRSNTSTSGRRLTGLSAFRLAPSPQPRPLSFEPRA
ncbi:BZ3500_MvSof-1268-A1-R1_C045g00140 [Microbotryum saponariae]|uniref:BZ3500_MvSof-1268-A1-R1_C045g00140 protein n=1 Tax=Microbotryum saponariae TaxID=289078 RepID=A0A2X0M4T2_9BASI|nr:BZ3500_MvSof-1268-A1-R1_C045g00140 [Microbotryum saponariae]